MENLLASLLDKGGITTNFSSLSLWDPSEVPPLSQWDPIEISVPEGSQFESHWDPTLIPVVQAKQVQVPYQKQPFSH